LVLLTFVENIFKHGILNDPAHPATVCIKCADALLRFSARNKKRMSSVTEGNGIGIQNVETRLKSLYREDAFCLNIREDETYHSINLQVKLTC